MQGTFNILKQKIEVEENFERTQMVTIQNPLKRMNNLKKTQFKIPNIQVPDSDENTTDESQSLSRSGSGSAEEEEDDDDEEEDEEMQEQDELSRKFNVDNLQMNSVDSNIDLSKEENVQEQVEKYLEELPPEKREEFYEEYLKMQTTDKEAFEDVIDKNATDPFAHYLRKKIRLGLISYKRHRYILDTSQINVKKKGRDGYMDCLDDADLERLGMSNPRAAAEAARREAERRAKANAVNIENLTVFDKSLTQAAKAKQEADEATAGPGLQRKSIRQAAGYTDRFLSGADQVEELKKTQITPDLIPREVMDIEHQPTISESQFISPKTEEASLGSEEIRKVKP